MNISDKSRKKLVLIGRNGAGKTYLLEKVLRDSNAIMLTGDGAPILGREINKVEIDTKRKMYIYNNESQRGIVNNPTEVSIDSKIYKLVIYCNKILGKLNSIDKLSKGQEKLKNMMMALTQYNLNNIKYILFDEPDTYLDEEYLKIIVEVVNIIIESDICVRISTHSPRLLKILNLDISEILLINRLKTPIILSNDKIIEEYNLLAEKMEEFRRQSNVDKTSGLDFKLNMGGNKELIEYFVEQNIKNEKFYRCLFCNTVIIVEGESEIIALEQIKDEIAKSVCVFSANGKAFIPFFVWLFVFFSKEVIVVIDEDNIKKRAYEITLYLKKLDERGEIKLVTHNPDLEGFYEINDDEIATQIGMSDSVKKNNRGWLKIIASYISFKEADKRSKLINHIFQNKEGEKFDFV